MGDAFGGRINQASGYGLKVPYLLDSIYYPMYKLNSLPALSESNS